MTAAAVRVIVSLRDNVQRFSVAGASDVFDLNSFYNCNGFPSFLSIPILMMAISWDFLIYTGGHSVKIKELV